MKCEAISILFGPSNLFSSINPCSLLPAYVPTTLAASERHRGGDRRRGRARDLRGQQDQTHFRLQREGQVFAGHRRVNGSAAASGGKEGRRLLNALGVEKARRAHALNCLVCRSFVSDSPVSVRAPTV